MRSRSMAGILGGLAGTSLLVGAWAGPVWASAAAPPGNNGTIKVDGQPLDQGHDNEPHPGCTFRLTFFGFDAGTDTAAVTFDAQAPTASSQLLQDTVTFTATRDQGGATFDGASPIYDLSSALAGFSPSNQGYHVKVSVSVDGGNAKHKVLWVDSCSTRSPAAAPAAAPSGVNGAAARRPTTAAATPTAPTTTGATPITTPIAVDTTVEEVGTAGPALAASGTIAPTRVLGETVTRSPLQISAQSASQGAGLAFTGFDALLASAAGLVLLAVGFVLRRASRAAA